MIPEKASNNGSAVFITSGYLRAGRCEELTHMPTNVMGKMGRGVRNVIQNVAFSFGGKSPLIVVDPIEIKYVQAPEWWIDIGRTSVLGGIRRMGGDWDVIERDRSLFWSGKYEMGSTPRRVIPIESYGFYRAIEGRFLYGEKWEDTTWYGWIVKSIEENRKVNRYESYTEFRERLQYIEDLYRAMQEVGYIAKTAYKDNGISRISLGLLKRVFRTPLEFDEPSVNIGRDQRIILDDGRHRVCVARVAGLREIPVRVSVVHKAVNLRSVFERI